jgi:tRNA (cytidine/uridine-2'-O-)-methyltransferase
VRPEQAATLHIALLRPEIGPNAGNIGRLCLGIEAVLHLIRPLGFEIDDKAVRRAGLDYWKDVRLMTHSDENAFWDWASSRRVWLYSSHGARPHTAAPFQAGDVLVFGSESVGLPRALVAARGALQIPMTGPIRSLNLANAVAVAAYAALQQISPELFGQEGGS